MARYIGARYVPVFAGDWDQTREYEALTVVQYQGDSYTSKMYVPVGIAINNTMYWIKSANFNQQVAAMGTRIDALQGQYDQDIEDLQGDVEDVQGDITALTGRMGTAENNITRIDGFITNDLSNGGLVKAMFTVKSASVSILSVGAGSIKSGSVTLTQASSEIILGVVGTYVITNNFTLKTAYVDSSNVLHVSVMNHGNMVDNCNVECRILTIHNP